MPDSPDSASSSSEPIDAEIVPDPTPEPTALPVHQSPPQFSPPPAFTPDYSDAGVPSFDYVRDKIEGRFATSIGSTELAGETEQGRKIEEQEAERAKKAADKLAEIRKSMGL
ncbi:hypothetical protein [Pseudonocardia sp. GCM10023141]|uniref:hypothetical protein n=1 Tax=Pseudonocardia sp. GCM10023141 TaxID=3252653 RepID=UPI003622AD22